MRQRAVILLVMLVAAVLRLAAITHAPPGLTHDEADHGQAAWEIAQGDRPIYSTVGYGREPLYDYATAALMTFLGPTYLAGRLSSAFFSLFLVAATYAWTRRAFGQRVAWLTAAGLAVSFWGVMTGRQALRSVTLPALLTPAVYCFWRGLERNERKPDHGRQARTSILGYFSLAGVLLGGTFYTYLPARLTWFLFPAVLFYLALVRRPLARRVWPGILLSLILAATIAAPLLYYLATTPAAEARLGQLDEPLQTAAGGDLAPLWQNVVGGLSLLANRGDSLWRYNLPGRPLLSPALRPLFYLGLAAAFYQAFVLALPAVARQNPKSKIQNPKSLASFLALTWFLLGLLPVLITGPDLSTTRLIAAQPVFFLFPALGLAVIGNGLLAIGRRPAVQRYLFLILVIVLYSATLVGTVHDYFIVWANHPQVRVQYETALVETIDYLNEYGRGPAVISTTTPGRFHSPAVGLLTLTNEQVSLRWFNGQSSLLLPQNAPATLIFSGFASLNPALAGYFNPAAPVTILPRRENDLDKPLTIYEVDGRTIMAVLSGRLATAVVAPAGATVPVDVGQALTFLGYDLQTPLVKPGESVRLATVWRVKQPLEEAVLFTHVVGADGRPIAQADRLDAPSYYWVAGDVFIQLHEFLIPPGTAAGAYPLRVGVYTRPDEHRLPIWVEGAAVGDTLQLPPLQVIP